MFKIFGSKKEEFFLEIDDSQGTPKAEAPAAPAAAAPATEAPAAPTAQKSATAKPEAPKAAAPAAVAPVAPTAPAVPTKPKAPEPVVLFAPDNLLPLPNPTRRRPGPNMASFLNMAQQMQRR
jgi:hypothetical protein